MQAIELIQNKMKAIHNYRVVHAMKMMKLNYIREASVNVMRACLAIEEMGLPITGSLVAEVMGVTDRGIHGKLHLLGDKHCLLLKRGTVAKGMHASTKHVYQIGQAFKNYYK